MLVKQSLVNEGFLLSIILKKIYLFCLPHVDKTNNGQKLILMTENKYRAARLNIPPLL